MSVLEFLGMAWILSVVVITVCAVGSGVRGWLLRRRGNALGYIDRYRVDPDVRDMVARMREREPRL